MNLLSILQKERSKKNNMDAAKYIGNNPERFAELIEIMIGSDLNLANLAAWIIPSLNDKYTNQLIQPHLNILIELLNKPVHDAIKRNALRMLQFATIPEKLQGITLEYCFQLLNNPKEAIAIRVYAMTVLYNLTLQEPDLAHELYDSIEMHMHGALPGYKSRGGKILKALSKMRK
jgi:hypothetical protein